MPRALTLGPPAGPLVLGGPRIRVVGLPTETALASASHAASHSGASRGYLDMASGWINSGEQARVSPDERSSDDGPHILHVTGALGTFVVDVTYELTVEDD